MAKFGFSAVDHVKSDRLLARIFHQLTRKIGQAIVCTADFPIERNTRVYFRLRVVVVQTIDQTRAALAG